MVAKQHALGDAILRDPDVETVSSLVGVDGANTTLNTGRFYHFPEAASAAQIERRRGDRAAAEPRRREIPGMPLYMQPVQDLTIDSTVSKAAYHFVLQNANPGVLDDWTPKLVERLREAPELANVASDLAEPRQGARHRDRSRHGGALRHHDGDRRQRALRLLRSAHRLDDLHAIQPISRHSRDRSRMPGVGDALASLYLPSSASSSGQVPLSAIVHIEERDGPLQITHLGQFPATTISFDLAPGVSLGAAVEAIETAQAEIAFPQSFTLTIQGAAAAFHDLARPNELAADPRGDRDDVYRARRAL